MRVRSLPFEVKRKFGLNVFPTQPDVRGPAMGKWIASFSSMKLYQKGRV